MSLSPTRKPPPASRAPWLTSLGKLRVGLGLLFLGMYQGGHEAAGQEFSFLRLEPGGPGGQVTGLCFSPDSGSLYVAGWSKTVQVWRRSAAIGELEQDRKATLRVPIGPGSVGVINATSLSSDGRWLAVGGQGAREWTPPATSGTGSPYPMTCCPRRARGTEARSPSSPRVSPRGRRAPARTSQLGAGAGLRPRRRRPSPRARLARLQ